MKPTTLSLLKFTALLLSAVSPATSCQVQTNWKITFFGYPDNSPSGGDIAFDCGRGFTAGGDGSLGDPVTMAAAFNVFAKCEVIYIPYLKKYARYEDYCGQCGKDKKLGLTHIDIWIGSSKVNGGRTQERCEETLTRTNKRIVRNPDSGLEVDTQSLFSGGKCGTNAIYADSGISANALCGGIADDAGSSSFSVAAANIDQSENLFAFPSLDSEITVPTPTPSPSTAATPPSGIGNISPTTEDIPYPQWGDFVPTTTLVAGKQVIPPAAAAASNEPPVQAANGNSFLLPTSSEQATPIDYYQQTSTTNENGDEFFASLPFPPPASGQKDGTNFKNLAVPQTGKFLDSSPSPDLGVESTDSLGTDNGEILQFVPGIGKKLRVRRTGGKWRAMV